MEIIESREAILNTLDKMFKDYITINDQHSQEMKEIINKNTELDRLNKKLFNERQRGASQQQPIDEESRRGGSENNSKENVAKKD